MVQFMAQAEGVRLGHGRHGGTWGSHLQLRLEHALHLVESHACASPSPLHTKKYVSERMFELK